MSFFINKQQSVIFGEDDDDGPHPQRPQRQKIPGVIPIVDRSHPPLPHDHMAINKEQMWCCLLLTHTTNNRVGMTATSTNNNAK
mmetsp:Transcript_1278/g.2717  ORF Transcript_1278/g.2717 Transcript_1278/m.2717 type:complete len:84 (+) Transcript_1278:168-419(+)